MKDSRHQMMVREVTRNRYRDSLTLDSRTTPRYPKSAEREYARINRMYMKLLKESIRDHMPEIMEVCQEDRLDARYDSSFHVSQRIRKIMQTIAEEIEQKIGDFGLEERLEQIANLANNAALEEWRRSVKKTLGIDIFKDYYKGETYTNALKRWTSENISRVKSIPTEALGNLEKTILEGYQNGRSLKQLQKDIQSSYDMDKRRAELLARDQISTLNAQVTKMQQTDSGVTKYKWSTSHDGRVRECHAELDGQVFSWDDPPEMWYETKSMGIVYTGRYCHPGEDYMCRCVAIPVFDWQTVDVPMSSSD